MACEKTNTGAFTAALKQLTRMELPGTDSPETLNRSLFWYPVIGLGIGLVAALPVMLAIKYLRLMQGLVLFTSVIYLFLLEYIAGFRQMRQFTEVCAMRSSHESAGNFCGIFLMIGKALVLYLIFLRLALFGDLMPLGIFLIFTPAAARLLMLLPLTSPLMKKDFSENAGSADSAATLRSSAMTFAVIASCALSAVLWTVIRAVSSGTHPFFSAYHGITRVIAILRVSLQRFPLLFVQGIHDTVVLAGCCAIFWMIWHSEQKFLPQTRETCIRMSGAYCETMELALQIGTLILIDCIYL